MKKFIETIQEVWFIIIFIGGLILWYGSVTNQLKQIEAKDNEQDLILQQLMSMKTDVAVIKTNVEFLKERIK